MCIIFTGEEAIYYCITSDILLKNFSHVQHYDILYIDQHLLFQLNNYKRHKQYYYICRPSNPEEVDLTKESERKRKRIKIAKKIDNQNISKKTLNRKIIPISIIFIHQLVTKRRKIKIKTGKEIKIGVNKKIKINKRKIKVDLDNEVVKKRNLKKNKKGDQNQFQDRNLNKRKKQKKEMKKRKNRESEVEVQKNR